MVISTFFALPVPSCPFVDVDLVGHESPTPFLRTPLLYYVCVCVFVEDSRSLGVDVTHSLSRDAELGSVHSGHLRTGFLTKDTSKFVGDPMRNVSAHNVCEWSVV